MIHNKLRKRRVNNNSSILIGLHQTSAFTIINHTILIKKCIHIGFSNKTIALMKSYLKDRSQTVFVNGSNSELKYIGDQGCFQGTIMAMLIYVIYILGQPSIDHIQWNHENS